MANKRAAKTKEEQAQAKETVFLEDFLEVQKKLDENQIKAAEYLAGWQRAQAEFVNYKKRIEREQAEYAEMTRAQTIKKFLPAIDDLERALENRPEGEQSWGKGIQLIYEKFIRLLEVEGVVRIEALGQEFDPHFHEAIAMEPSEEFESGQVIAVIQQGYKIGERVIRPAMVKVAQ